MAEEKEHSQAVYRAVFTWQQSKALFNTKIIILWAYIRYEMADSHKVHVYLISNKHKWNNCFIKNSLNI